MLKIWRKLISGQYGAALCMLSRCIDQCPESSWNEPVGNLKFCQVVFHALFFTDFYLEESDRTFRDQPFHRENAEFFRNYEELEYVEQKQLYDRASIRKYLQHCRTKFARVIDDETEQTLAARCGFERREFSRAELHVCNIRHIQHHASQLRIGPEITSRFPLPCLTRSRRRWCFECVPASETRAPSACGQTRNLFRDNP